MSVAAGDRVGPYEIVAPLGAGGMGEVWRARDARLDREVAIKVLPQAFAAETDRLRRFELEARATAALDHPNILAVYDVGSHEGSPYLVEQLLEGNSLRERLRSGALVVQDAIDTAVAIARGLGAAHAKGIIHRDLKPENVFITNDGVVKILDFGLAKLAGGEDGPDLSAVPTASAPRTVLGTAGYMSPEQVRGQPCDHRADVFAFGCVLYELLSGRRAFQGATQVEALSAILNESPPPLPATVPAFLRAIVARCLEKRPGGRYQSCLDLAHDLQTASAGLGETSRRSADGPAGSRRFPPWVLLLGAGALAAAVAVVVVPRPSTHEADAGGPRRIVVLPFENLGSPEDAYFAAGMADEISSRLANVKGLRVISRTSAAECARRGESVARMGRELGVDYVLEGSIRWEHGTGRESRVRITPELIRVADDTSVWSDRYDRVVADVFAIQSDVAANAVKAMDVTLLPRERTALSDVSTADVEAHDLYLRGKALENGGEDRKLVEGALQLYESAVDRDHDFALALAGVARTNLEMYWLQFDRSQERLARAKEAAERAVRLRPDLAESHAGLGWYFYQGQLDYQRALAEFGTAVSIQPGDSDALFGTGAVLRRQGRWTDAADAMAEALISDPENAEILYNLGETCVLARRYAAADRAFAEAISVSPHASGTYGRRAWLQIEWKGDTAGARALLDDAARAWGGSVTLTDTDAYWSVIVAMVRRDDPKALELLDSRGGRAFDLNLVFRPIALLRAELQLEEGKRDEARSSLAEARSELVEKVAHAPDDARFHSALAVALAGLGQREAAVREARRAFDLAVEDSWLTVWCRTDLATVFTLLGDTGDAIQTLDDVLGRNGEWTVHVLQLDPRWDPLRADARFHAMLARHESAS